jgi:hypothetical protein
MSEPDPKWVRNQPSLTTSTGRIWLVVGGLFAAIAFVLLVALGRLNSLGFWAAAIIALLYAVMLLVRAWVVPVRLRLGLLAALMLTMAALALASVFVIAWGAAT